MARLHKALGVRHVRSVAGRALKISSAQHHDKNTGSNAAPPGAQALLAEGQRPVRREDQVVEMVAGGP